MTKTDLSEQEQDLLEEIYQTLDDVRETQKEIIKCQDGFINRFLTSVAIGVTIFLFIMAGSYAYTSKVSNDTNKNAQSIIKTNSNHDVLEREVGHIDGALAKRFPESAVFGEANRRIILRRGDTQ